MNAMPTIDEMRRATLERDRAYDGLFVLGVRTTGIFCRPTCPARKPKAENVEYFRSTGEALRAGYRACKRCRPMEVDDRPEWVGGLLEELERDPAARIDERRLKGMGIDPATARRFFRKHYGMTFQGFARAQRLSRAFTMIREGGSIDIAINDSGFESHSGFRDAFARAFGGPPGKAAMGRDCVRLAWFRSPLGPMVAGATDDGVCLLEFADRRMLEGQLRTVARHFNAPVVPGRNEHLDRLEDELNAYFDGTLRAFEGPLIDPGTPFQRRVWERLREIPYGETRSYQEIAEALGDPRAVRAVGRANGLNRIAIVIPCHRVVNKDGRLGGYGGGLHRKQFLLDLEQGRRLAIA